MKILLPEIKKGMCFAQNRAQVQQGLGNGGPLVGLRLGSSSNLFQGTLSVLVTKDTYYGNIENKIFPSLCGLWWLIWFLHPLLVVTRFLTKTGLGHDYIVLKACLPGLDRGWCLSLG